ncbi:hypothetical protein [Azospirillum sp. Sh1]|uniref:hypothetical protein n=1 Tax=Azospirillum sp. Sh1 TaxID=2607285 RepID=UPI0011EBCC5E|nr:hypothetical protein [Azospirillum sp. Sh1]KAA0576660.1 hypothetical protein FZ029_12395 [Azospirillum sp. Sh1]
MKTETEDTAPTGERKRLSLRESLTSNTALQSVSASIAEASIQAVSIYSLMQDDQLSDQEYRDASSKFQALTEAVIGATPQTLPDATAMLSTILAPPEAGLTRADYGALCRVRDFLRELLPEVLNDLQPVTSTTIPTLGITIAEASRRAADLIAEANSPTSAPTEDRVNEIHAELIRLEEIVIAEEPRSVLDAASILDTMFPIDASAKLSRDIPAVRRVAAFLHRFAGSAKATVPAHADAGQPTEKDAGIFAACSRFEQLMRAVHATDDEDETARLIDQADEVALEVIKYEPVTMEGLAAQVCIMLHLEHGSPTGNLQDILFETVGQAEEGPHYRASNTLVDRVKQLYRRNAEQIPLEGHHADLTPEHGNAIANDQHQDADAFADTVAAFEAEAPATLALPLEPTSRMVDAGASAAGITPAQFQAAYAAAVEALKLERAA